MDGADSRGGQLLRERNPRPPHRRREGKKAAGLPIAASTGKGAGRPEGREGISSEEGRTVLGIKKREAPRGSERKEKKKNLRSSITLAFQREATKRGYQDYQRLKIGVD